MARLDPHSYADAAQPSTRVLDLDLEVDFDARVLRGSATLELDRPLSGDLDLDTRGLAVTGVFDDGGQPLAHTLHAPEGFMGARLTVTGAATKVRVDYETSPDATALQWLSPEQTGGGRHPYVFTQCQAIHARSVTPCQDSPRVRQEVKARLRIPQPLTAVMGAAEIARTVVDSDRVIHEFHCPQPIPSYLLAFAVGDVASREIGPRSRVWAEPGALEAAAWEMAKVDDMLTAAETLFGPYRWDRFDLLIMPPSFPYGGMENPRLTFLTPTLLAGDRSLVNVVAHELAHSWTGNLVTNASMNDFWLNEGFTVYAERRILEALEGEEARALHAALGRRGLDDDVRRLEAKDPAFTRLENDLAGVDPDEVYSQVPYEKGFLFVTRLEQAVGREAFDRFLAQYIDRFAFTSITTRDFLLFLQDELPEALDRVDVEAWVRGVGIPDDAPAAESARLDRLLALARRFGDAEPPQEDELAALSPTEWQVLLSSLPRTISEGTCRWLDETFHLSEAENHEIRVAWLTVAIRSGYRPAWNPARETLRSVGRGKYLRPLFTALVENGPEGRAFAKEIFRETRAGYHPVAQALVSGVVGGGAG